MTDKNNWKNVFRYLWESLAYLQAFFDDTILYTIHKLQEKADKETDIKKKQKIHQKILSIIGTGLSKSVWEAWAWFYEKYADLKKWDNLAETMVEKDIPRVVMKWKQTLTKMDILWLKRWNLEDLKKLKDKLSPEDKIKIKKSQMPQKMQMLDIKKWDLEGLRKLIK